MFRTFNILIVCIFFACNVQGGNYKVPATNKLDIVFCLDLSGSTNGLIIDVRESLWHIVNQVKLLEPAPEFRLGLVGFSRPSFKQENAYVKVLCDLTKDFDRLSHEMYKIRPAVEKGDQYVGAALNTCISEISWSEDKNARKIIYIVGNGLVGTNNNEYVKACELAVSKNIVINSIYVMGRGDIAREKVGWYRLAKLADGYTSEIAIGKKIPKVDSQVDFAMLIAASIDLSKTYIYHSKGGFESYQFYKAADSAALTASPSVFIERAYFKNSDLFKWTNAKWDMVDYLRWKGMLPPMDDTLTIADSLRSMPTKEIYNMVLDQKIKRQIIFSRMENMLKENYPLRIHKAYVAGELNEENSFARNVLIMLLKERK